MYELISYSRTKEVLLKIVVGSIALLGSPLFAMKLVNTVRSVVVGPAIKVVKYFRPDWNPRYTTDKEVEILCDLVRRTRGTVVEIGCNEGATLARLAEAAFPRQCIGIDCSTAAMNGLQCAERPQAYRIGIKARHLSNVCLIDCDSRDVESRLKQEEIGFIFIDGDHSLAGVRSDTEMALRLVKNGLIVWHDVSPSAPSFVKVWEYLNTQPHAHIARFIGTNLGIAVI